MSFYTKPTRRWPAALATGAVMLLIGVGIGYLIGESSAPTLSEQVSEARRHASDVAAKVAVIDTEYPPAVKNGKVIGSVEYSGAQARAEQVITEIDKLSGSYGTIDPEALKQARAAATKLRAAIDQKAGAAEVSALVAEVKKNLELSQLAEV